MAEFEIYLSDLTEQAQESLGKIIDLENSNYDVLPLTTLYFEEDDI